MLAALFIIVGALVSTTTPVWGVVADKKVCIFVCNILTRYTHFNDTQGSAMLVYDSQSYMVCCHKCLGKNCDPVIDLILVQVCTVGRVYTLICTQTAERRSIVVHVHFRLYILKLHLTAELHVSSDIHVRIQLFITPFGGLPQYIHFCIGAYIISNICIRQFITGLVGG